MALIGTHIRFALDIRDNFGIKNLDKYISGTVYPDSRYLTKIDRKITHCIDVYNKNFWMEDDFKKGWLIHLMYDKIQSEVFKEIFPELFVEFKNEESIVSPKNWVIRTVLKILQDLDDISKFNIKKYLKNLEYSENPNNEKIKIVKNYNQMLINIYQKDEVLISDLINMWVKFEIEEELIEQIRDKTKEFILDKNILERIPLIYPATIKRYKNLKLI